MEIIISKDEHSGVIIAANKIEKLIRSKPDAVLGLATGGTPIPLYRELVNRHKKGKIDFSRVRTFNLDEYVGLAPSHPVSFNYFMHEQLFNHINIKPENVHIPDGLAKDIPSYCDEYERKIRECGGIDIQILGVGTDGHIAFNEPTSSLSSRTRLKTLTEQSRKDNSRFFSSLDDVPYHAITMGIATILDSKMCILLAFGEKKAEVVGKLVEGPISAMIPATALQLHQHVIVITDESAAEGLAHVEYYQYVHDHKPDWQKH